MEEDKNRPIVDTLVALEDALNRTLAEARAQGLSPELMIFDMANGQHLHVHLAPEPETT